jgi:photosystem II stability/assembly factor-like uncharacterized protein
MSMKTALGAALAAAALAVASAAPAGAAVQVGASGWQWGNPLPQGNTLRTMAFTGSTGYAAGDFGTLLKTTDGGSTWSGLPVGTFTGLTTVQALDADTVFAGGGCVARRSTDGGASFTAVRFTAVESGCRVGLRDLWFVTRDVGYLLMDDGSVLTTTDGGTQFAPRTAVPETRAAGGLRNPGAIAFVSESKGYASSGGTLFQTLDGGTSWKVVSTDGRAIRELWFADATHGFAVGYGGLMMRTLDGGEIWDARDLGAGPRAYTGIRCSGTQLCVLTTEDGTQLVRTTDAGQTHGTVVTPSTDPIHAAAFASATRVAAVGANGATVRSDDAGVTFAPIGGRLSGRYEAIRAGGAAGTAYAPGAAGALAKTTDGGRTWTTGNVPTSADLIDVSFPTEAVGYALDRDAGLFRTGNGGGVWKALGTGSVRRPRAVLAPDANTVLVVGPRGMRRSTDAGETFEPVAQRSVRNAELAGVSATPSGVLFAWGPKVVLRSSDRGRTWSAVSTPGARARIRPRIAQVAFSSATAGLLRGAGGLVWRTIDAGRTWTPLPAVGTTRIAGMAAVSARTAYLVSTAFGARTGGFLLRTDDGGATWQPQFVVDAPIRPSGLAVAEGVDYLLAGDASLLFSTTGGVAGASSELTLATRARRLTRSRRITVTGRLAPASGGAQVVVSALLPGGSSWTHQTVSVAANGTFATAWRVPRGTTAFVAQWTGDFESAGAGSRALTVTVAPRARQPRRGRARRR